MGKIITFLIILTTSVTAFGQLPSKVKKMEGTWEYQFRSGFEILKVEGDELIGSGYRVNLKSNDTSKVEHIRIQMLANSMVYSMTTYFMVADSVVTTTQKFVSSKKKLLFQNITDLTPNSIKYSFGFLNRNKMIIRVYLGPGTKPTKLILTRKQE